jgi:hypothetical protein
VQKQLAPSWERRFQREVFGILPNTALSGSNAFGKDAERGTLEACTTEFHAMHAQLRQAAGFPRKEKLSSDARSPLKGNAMTTKQPLAINGMHHVWLRVRDIERSLSFYRDALGFSPKTSVILDGLRFAMLETGNDV